jgi:hypothetical protein
MGYCIGVTGRLEYGYSLEYGGGTYMVSRIGIMDRRIYRMVVGGYLGIRLNDRTS